jgi:hypothetical protein
MTVCCPACSCDTWEGPRYVSLTNPMPPGWPRGGGRYREYGLDAPHADALVYRCSCCGYTRFQKTVQNGGPAPERPKKDAPVD